jgi:hypothetical protein
VRIQASIRLEPKRLRLHAPAHSSLCASNNGGAPVEPKSQAVRPQIGEETRLNERLRGHQAGCWGIDSCRNAVCSHPPDLDTACLGLHLQMTGHIESSGGVHLQMGAVCEHLQMLEPRWSPRRIHQHATYELSLQVHTVIVCLYASCPTLHPDCHVRAPELCR